MNEFCEDVIVSHTSFVQENYWQLPGCDCKNVHGKNSPLSILHHATSLLHISLDVMLQGSREHFYYLCMLAPGILSDGFKSSPHILRA